MVPSNEIAAMPICSTTSGSPSTPTPALAEDFTPPVEVMDHARQVLDMEAAAIRGMAARLDSQFAHALNLLLECSGKVVVTGMGKSGHVGGKIAATFASTGTPAFFVHPAELRHGDFGMLDERDLLVALSSSGETQEIKLVLEPIKRLGIRIISLTGNRHSTLAKLSEAVLDVGVEREACPLNLAPTSSTTAMLAMGDALAIVLMTRKGFRAEDFARSHPGGFLGKQLITVRDIMRFGGEVPTVSWQAGYHQVLQEIDAKKLGFTCVCNPTGKLSGIITDGDLRRAIIKYGSEVFRCHASEIMTANPKTISSDALAAEALKLMEKYAISDLLIIDANSHPAGLIHLKDLLRAGVI